MKAPPRAELVRLRSATFVMRRRLRASGALQFVGKNLPFVVLLLTPGAVLYRMRVLSGPLLILEMALALLLFAAFTVRVWRRGPGLLAASLALDRFHRLSGRLPAIWEFSEKGGASGVSVGPISSEFEALVIEGARDVGTLRPKQASPFLVPGALWHGLLMGTLLSALLLLPEPAPQLAVQPKPASQVAKEKKWVSEDDSALLREAAEKLHEKVESQEGKAAAQRFNEIVLQVVTGELDQREAFRMAAELQADLESGSSEAKSLNEGLKKRGESLARRKITREIGEALKEERFSDAKKAFEKLAERLSQGKDALSQEELNQLRESLEEARKAEQEAKSEAEKKSEEARAASAKNLQKRINELKKKEAAGKASPQEQNEIKKAERQLKRLNRQKKERTAKQELSELDKKLAAAAKELQKEQKKSGQFLDQAGRQVEQSTQKQLSQEEKKELLKQIEEMKERLRRQNKDGKQAERLRKFQEKVRAQRQKQGQSGQPKPGQGKQGSKPGKARLGPGGAPLPSAGQASPQPGQAKGEGQGPDTPGREAGSGHDPQMAGEASRLPDAKHEDTSAVAQDSGEGESASETIVTAAEEGFSSAAYERLFTEYRTVAEDVMERETVPRGRRAHVRRYFELIRPRGELAPESEKQDKE